MVGNTSRNDNNRDLQRLPKRSVSVRDRIGTMISAEQELQSSSDHIALAQAASSFQNATWRHRVSQWCYDVIDHLNLPRDVVFMAMNILDRFIAVAYKDGSIGKDAYEVAAITALFLGIRISGSTEITVPDLLRISRSSAHPKDINSTGAKILSTLTFSHQKLTPSSFVKAFMGLLSNSLSTHKALSLYELASYLVEISVCDQQFCQERPQELAFAALVIALREDTDGSVDRKVFSMLLRQVEQDTGMKREASTMNSLCSRLRGIYEQSVEITADFVVPHVIIEDEEEETSRKRSIATIACDPVVDVRPASSTNEESPRKKVRALY